MIASIIFKASGCGRQLVSVLGYKRGGLISDAGLRHHWPSGQCESPVNPAVPRSFAGLQRATDK